MNPISQKIDAKLSELESQSGFRILFAVESGSRAWGFASEDSDYDVRFVYRWPTERYLAVVQPLENLEAGIDEDAIDLSGWEFRKALRLFLKSNGALCEWIRSPVVYRKDARVLAEWLRLLDEVFDPKANAVHYLGLARQMWQRIRDEEKVTAKRYLYALRALLSARFVLEGPAPVPFGELIARLSIPDGLRADIDRMITEKSGGRERDGIPRETLLEDFLASELDALGGTAATLGTRVFDDSLLDRFFRETLSA
jgi:predicted nucleotidyltransferase